MEIRYENSPREVKAMPTEELRANFLAEKLITSDEIQMIYTHYDRVIIGGVKPVQKSIALPVPDALKAAYFLERRELGIINVGGEGEVEIDDKVFKINKLDCLYVEKGTQKVIFKSISQVQPAIFFLMSAPAHQAYPTEILTKEGASPVQLGNPETSNQRTIYKYIHAEGLKSCQLVMGLTVLQPGNVWNTMPPHVHDRRMEAYFYFDVAEEQRVFHFMGQPQETRHLLVANHQAIISPPWSIHAGCGTSNYSFIWGMAGENYTFTDMDFVTLDNLR